MNKPYTTLRKYLDSLNSSTKTEKVVLKKLIVATETRSIKKFGPTGKSQVDKED